MRDQRNNIVYIHHIYDAIKKIATYTSSHSYDDFIDQEWDQDAAKRNLEIIGEAANNLDDSFQNQYSEIPWRKIVNFRNVLAHDYADLDIDIIWDILTKELPVLLNQIENVLQKEKS